MRKALYDPRARKQTVSLTLNSDLYAKVRESGINASRIAEQALAAELEHRRREAVQAEIRQDLDAYNRFLAENGSFADMARDHYADAAADDAV